MKVDVVDSPYFCKRRGCGKRLVQESGQNENTGELETVHTCWSCGEYSFTERPERSRVVDPALLAAAQEAIRRHREHRPVPAPAAFQAILEETG